jgi:hypothetical protein
MRTQHVHRENSDNATLHVKLRESIKNAGAKWFSLRRCLFEEKEIELLLDRELLELDISQSIKRPDSREFTALE